MKKHIYTILLTFSAAVGTAQENFGIGTSNWSGMQSLYLNPASIADGRQNSVLQLGALNLKVDNSLGNINPDNGIMNLLVRTTDGSKYNTSQAFVRTSNSSFNMLAPAVDVQSLGLIMPINRNSSIAFSTRMRAINEFTGFSPELYQTLNNKSYVPASNHVKFNWTSHLWSEINIAYGIVLIHSAHSTLKAGITVRYLGGISYLYMKGSMDINPGKKDSLFCVSDANIRYSTNQTTSNNEFTKGLNSNLGGDFFSVKSGKGLGGDMGLSYEFRTAADETDADAKYNRELKDNNMTWSPYKVRVAASMLDLGNIVYPADNANNMDIKGDGSLTGLSVVNHISNYNEMRTYLQKHGLITDTGSAAVKLYMPTRALITVDYNVYHDFYVNAAYQGNVASLNNPGNYFFDQWTVTPRFDNRWVTVAMPVTYSTLADDFKLGLAFRIGGLFLGSDDMLGFFGNKAHGFNAYLGFHLALNKRLPR